MDFDQILDQAIEMLQRRGRLTYRSLKRQFQLDAETLDDLKFELIEGQQIATDEKETVLVWTGSQEAISQSTSETPRSTPTPLEQGLASYTPPYLAEKIRPVQVSRLPTRPRLRTFLSFIFNKIDIE